jgi:hypothetical protein
MAVITIAILAGCGLILYGILSLMREEKGEPSEVPVISVQDLSHLWTGDRIEIRELFEAPEAGQEEEKTTPSEPEPKVLKEAREIEETCIKPYLSIIEAQGALGVVNSLIDLIEKHGSCPSIAVGGSDQEAADLTSVARILANVNLRDHTYSVLKIIVSILGEEMTDPEHAAPVYIVCALAHDIGKIPEFRLSGIYNSSEHAFISAQKLREIMKDTNISWAETAIEAVRSHHARKAPDTVTYLLKRADQRARAYELARATSGFEVMPLEQWFDTSRFLKEYILPDVNRAQRDTWKAFILKGILFVRPDALYESASQMGRDMKKLDMCFIYTSEQEQAMRRIVKILRENGLIHKMLPDDRYSLFFELKLSVPHIKKPVLSLTPLRLEPFLNICGVDIVDLERRKTDILAVIDDVILK